MTKYSWKRFWCKREGAYSLADRGYLYDPEGEHGRSVQPDVVAFDQLIDHQALILLGEPGIGKSTAIRDAYEQQRENLQGESHESKFVQLNEYGDESRLIRDCFECDQINRWREGEGILHLFFDSLDECTFEIRAIARILASELLKLKPLSERLRIRIACRTWDWPSSLEDAILDIWGESATGAFELVPLRRVDVVLAADAEGLQPTQFLQDVGDRECESLAIVPVSLGFLLNIAKKHGEFPRSRVPVCFALAQLLTRNQQVWNPLTTSLCHPTSETSME